MENAESTIWLRGLLTAEEGYEWDAFERFADRLLRLASSKMPAELRPRVDAEDLVQSVFKSFFARNSAGQFEFDESLDVWRLLAAITFRKVQRAARFHTQQQRDVRREQVATPEAMLTERHSPTASSVIIMAESLEHIFSKLPETHQEVLRLRLDGHSIPEIAEVLQVSTRTVDRGLALARKVAEDEVREQ